MSYERQDWEEIGGAIQDIIESAINSKDYQRLNQTVTQAVGKAVDTGTEAVRKAVNTVNQNAQNARRGVQTNKNVYSSHISSVAPKPPQENLPALYRSPNGKMAGGIIKTVGGSLLTLGTSMELLATAIIKTVIAPGSFLSVLSVAMMAGLAGGAWLLGSGIRTIGRMNRFEKYVRTLGRKTYCSLEQLARSVDKPAKFVRRELGGMIDEGLFLEGHLDTEGTSLITSNDTYQHYLETQKRLAEQKLLEQREAMLKLKQPKIDPQVQEVLDKGNAFIQEIHRCNDAIPGEEISEKIYRMENIVQKIFDRAKAHPEIVPDLKKMMDYYLPMTVKLLRAYADMDAQPIQGQTIENSKREIEATLDTLNQAFEKLLDSVFKETALDVSSDISVLQTLLAQEGLTQDEFQKMKK